jgi:hypothetical protein
MAINFPNNPTVNETFSAGTTTWQWNGVAWAVVPLSTVSFTNLTVSGDTELANLEVGNLTLTGTLTGVDLNDLSNVSAPSPTNNQVLTYNQSLGRWVAAATASTFNGGTVTNPLIVNNSSVTTGQGTGALRVTGGVSINDDLYVGGTITIEDESLDIRSSGEIRMFNTANTGYVGFSAPDTISANRIYVLPQGDGSSGQYLRTNGSGVLSWASVTSPSGGTPPGGVDTQIQFNDVGEFGGNASLTFNSSTQLVTAPKITATGAVSVTDTTASTTTTTGSLKTAGGAGVAGQLNVGGAVNKFTGNTASSSTTTGTIVVTGGMGISGAVNVGSTVSSPSAPTSEDHLTNKQYVDANILAFSVAFGA